MEPSSSQSTPDPAGLRAARGRVKRLREFLQLCLIAVLVIAPTAGVNLATSPHRVSVPWVVLGYAMALALTALATFRRDLCLGRAWQRREMCGLLAPQAR